MEIRQLRADEFEIRKALTEFAFQKKWTEKETEERQLLFRPENDWGAFDEQGALLSALLIHTMDVWIQGKKLAMGGVSAVATWPEARRQGCVSRLLVHALETMRSNGQTISMLHPFAFPFYHKYGYEMTIERKKYTIETKQLPPRKEVPGQVKRMPTPDIEVLDGIYSAYASRFSGTLVRTQEWWESRLLIKTGAFAVYYNESNVPEGYVFYHIEDRKLLIHEWVSTNETSRVALWTFIGNHDSMINEVTTTVPIDDPLPFLLADPRIKQEIIPYFMSRIVDAQAFVGHYTWAPGNQDEAIVISLSDSHAPWNNGAYQLVWSQEGQGRLKLLEGDAAKAVTSEQGAIICDIQALTAMLVGNRKPSLLQEWGRISGSKESVELLERRIPERVTLLMDFF
ncbi:enhanced intracellular survival protein Eis [Cohnella sp. WQ 127256]|uniref:GNAT family N-acetyltransferase n=1 Tax=Cohnella sp. WQ 127256 TaxID=2938790 RepID=UPI002119A171|nr:GNAT family N-acetyltransferase [Cohnella sp. WQ 127256]